MLEWLQNTIRDIPYRYGATKRAAERIIFRMGEQNVRSLFIHLESFGQSQTDLISESANKQIQGLKETKTSFCLCNFEIQHDKNFQQIMSHIKDSEEVDINYFYIKNYAH